MLNRKHPVHGVGGGGRVVILSSCFLVSETRDERRCDEPPGLQTYFPLTFAFLLSRQVLERFLSCCFILQATFCGSSLGKRAGYHFNTADFESMGYHLCDTLLDYCDPDDSKVFIHFLQQFVFSAII